eukprot:jgi/Hompol1/4914/HPOL_004054-RA
MSANRVDALPLMVLHGQSAPFFAHIEASNIALVIGAAAQFQLMHTQAEPRSISPTVPNAVTLPNQPATPTYLWTQANDEVTIHIRLNNTQTTKGDLRIVLQPLLISVKSLRESDPYLSGTLFDAIIPAESLWTFEAAENLITLHLQKRNINSRWPHVFSHDDGVLETLDPSVLIEYTERLLKYHGDPNTEMAKFRKTTDSTDPKAMKSVSEIDSADRATEMGVGGGRSAVGSTPMQIHALTETQEQVDFEDDAFVVVRAEITFNGGSNSFGSLRLGKRAHSPNRLTVAEQAVEDEMHDADDGSSHIPHQDHSAQITHQSYMHGMSWIGTQLSGDLDNLMPAVIAKSDVDGLIVRISDQLEMAHIATLSALGYIQTSKRDKKLVCTTRQLDLGLVLESQRYLYIYERPSRTQHSATQHIVDLTSEDEATGQVLGIAQVGDRTLCVLQEYSALFIQLPETRH